MAFYLLGQKFTVLTDNRALTSIRKNKDLTARLTRWCLKPDEFNFAIIYIKGKTNIVPDALSRMRNTQWNLGIQNIIKLVQNKNLATL